MNEDRGCSTTGNIMLAFVLGGLVGAGIALLTAPHSGRETRERLKELSEETKKKAAEYAEQAKGKCASTIEHGKEFVEEKKSLISSAIEAGKDAYGKEKEKHSKPS